MYQHLQDYLARGIYPFHMPGHKRNPMFFPPRLFELDLTEIPGMDVLREPSGIMGDLQARIGVFYGSDESFLLVNGSTAGIIAAICATAQDGGRLYAARNGHVSMYSGIAVSGALPIYIQPEAVPGGLMGGISPAALDEMEEGAAVIVVSPTYEGFVSDIHGIAEKVHSRGGILIVDEAHGAHFPFHGAFPSSALAHGADIVVQSFHKTLPVLGQMGVLHVNGPRVDMARLKFYLHGLMTTSPSYMLMAQLDYALDILWRRPELFDMYASRLTALRKALYSEDGAAQLTGPEFLGRHGVFGYDQGKLLFRLKSGISAEEIAEMMADKYRLQMEMAARGYMLAMTSVADTDEAMQRLWAAVGAVNVRYDGAEETEPPKPAPEPETTAPAPEQVFTPRQAARQPTESVLWEAAAGRIAGEIMAAYPPGVALVAPGERIPQGLPKLAETVRVIRETQ